MESIGLTGEWEAVAALVEDLPDPACVAIMALVMREMADTGERRGFQAIVRARYRQLTARGCPDGPVSP